MSVLSLIHNALNLNVLFYKWGRAKRQHKKTERGHTPALTQNGGRLMESDSANKHIWSSGQKPAKIRDEGENVEEKSPD